MPTCCETVLNYFVLSFVLVSQLWKRSKSSQVLVIYCGFCTTREPLQIVQGLSWLFWMPTVGHRDVEHTGPQMPGSPRMKHCFSCPVNQPL